MIRVFVNLGGTWFQEATINPPGTGSFQTISMLNGATLFAGAPTEGNNGAVYVFTRSGSTWTQSQRIEAPFAPIGANFGDAISADGSTLAIGAPGWGDGRVNVYTRNGPTWNFQASLLALSTNDFGDAVALSGQNLVVASELTDEVLFWQRSGTNWSLQDRILVNGRANSVAFGGDDWYVGDFGLPTTPGRVRSGLRIGDDFNGNGQLDLCEIFNGTVQDTNDNGIPDECECGAVTNYCVGGMFSGGMAAQIGVSGSVAITDNTFALRVADAPANRPGIFFYGGGQSNVPFGDGFRCVSPGGMGAHRVNPIAPTNGSVKPLSRWTSPRPSFPRVQARSCPSVPGTSNTGSATRWAPATRAST